MAAPTLKPVVGIPASSLQVLDRDALIPQPYDFHSIFRYVRDETADDGTTSYYDCTLIVPVNETPAGTNFTVLILQLTLIGWQGNNLTLDETVAL